MGNYEWDNKSKTELVNEIEWLKSEVGKLSGIVEAAPLSIVITNTKGEIEFVNPFFCQLTGYSLDEAKGKNPRILKSGEQSPQFYKTLWETISSGKKWQGLFHNKKKNGELYWEYVSIFPQTDKEGNIVRYIAIKDDTTQEKKTRDTLERSESRFRILFESSNDAIMTLEPPSWKFSSGNNAAIKMFMVKDAAAFISYQPWVFSPEKQPDGSVSVEKAKEMIEIAMRDGSNFFKWTHMRLNGETFSATVLLTRVELGCDVFLQATVRDVTEQVMRDDEFSKKARELQVFYDASIGREGRILELKEELRNLKEELARLKK